MNKFILWCEDENATQDYATFVADTQRQTGFQGGTPASAIRVNTALRQANLVSAALMNALLPDNQTLDYRNDIPTVANAINTALTTKITGLAKTTKVNNATNADIASYASSDTSKGTIDTRLNTLAAKRTLLWSGNLQLGAGSGYQTICNVNAGDVLEIWCYTHSSVYSGTKSPRMQIIPFDTSASTLVNMSYGNPCYSFTPKSSTTIGDVTMLSETLSIKIESNVLSASFSYTGVKYTFGQSTAAFGTNDSSIIVNSRTGYVTRVYKLT